ncbi:hypothetical protein AX15_000293 [Amanita polypyramis BW_CC]|nr:hypothetical protein AX15_000293 [Amanita polypyramis BW_CC]
MLSFLSRMRLPGYGSTIGDDKSNPSLPLPATSKSQGRKRGNSASSITSKDGRPLHLNTLAISAPIPRPSPNSITGFDNEYVPAAGSIYNGSSSASVSSGSAVTAYQYPTSFSSLHQLQQQANALGLPGQRPYQYPAYSQSQVFTQMPGYGVLRTGPSNVAWGSSPGVGIAIGGEEEHDPTDVPLDEENRVAYYPHNPFPAVIRIDSGDYSYAHENTRDRALAAGQIGRPASAPPSETYAQQRAEQYQQQLYFATHDSASKSSSPTSPLTPGGIGKFNLRLNLNTNAEFAQGVQSLRDRITTAATTDVFAGAYDYPRAKQLSPIAEVDYVSPDSLKRTKSLPFMNSPSDVSAVAFSRQNTNNTINTNNPSPGGSGSQGSEVARPSPVYSSPFITRPLNRTVSQTSTRTHVSTASSIVPRITSAATKSNEPVPALPPLDFRPPFPVPHPSHTGSGPPLRPSKRSHQQGTLGGLSTIVGSEEGGSLPDDSKYMTDDVASLHAESFVTASSYDQRDSGLGRPTVDPDDYDDGDEEEGEGKSTARHGLPSASGESRVDLMSINSGRSQVQSASESFIARRWESDAGYGIGGRVTVLRTKRQGWLDTTPAFWAFWLGFVCPFLWLIGGWHFTHFGEQPPRLTFWEFYFNAGYWKDMMAYGFRRGRKRKSMDAAEQTTQEEQIQEMASVSSKKGKEKKRDIPPVTRWVAEKQPSKQRRERLYDPKRSMRGISFGYPFIPRPVHQGPRREDWTTRALRRFSRIVTAPNRLFDLLYGVKLLEVRGRPESSRRMFDPWIQRCRYAFCYAVILVSFGLCTASAYLIVYNTRQLKR